jgi:predicted SprT family Zn-dependent metalloprotease
MKVTQSEIRREIERIRAKCIELAPEHADSIRRIVFKLSSRMTRAAGTAVPRFHAVKISLAFFEDRKNFTEEFYETVTHEIAHLLSPPVRKNRRWDQHGPHWQRTHKALGGTGKRTHEMQLAQGYEARRDARTPVDCPCGCGQTMKLGPTQLKRHRAGRHYFLKGHRPRRRPEPFPFF